MKWKNIGLKIVTAAMTAAMGLQMTVQPIQASAAATQYLSEVIISYGRTDDEAKNWLTQNGYKVVNQNLNEGGEGFATPKHLEKEDGTKAQQGEELPFKVIEFVKETKRIILSHSRTFEEGKEEKKVARKHTAPKKDETPVINNQTGGTTLGDIDALAALKAKMEKGE